DELTAYADELGWLCKRYGFAYYSEWGHILIGWTRTDTSGVTLAQQGIDRLKAQGSLVRMPYWLSLLADLRDRQGRVEAARSTLDAALVDGRARQDRWWLPEVMRMRAAYDPPSAAVERIQAAAAEAAEQGSIALVDRCENDLAARANPGPGNAARGTVPRRRR